MKGARGILEQAFEACHQSEEIWLAAVKLESECDELKRARQILAKARTSASSPRVMMKSAKLDWCLGDLKAALLLLDEGINLYIVAFFNSLSRSCQVLVICKAVDDERTDTESIR